MNDRMMFYPAQALIEAIGADDGTLRSSKEDALYPSLSRRWNEIVKGRQEWVSVVMADKLMMACGHHIWELPTPVPASQSIFMHRNRGDAA